MKCTAILLVILSASLAVANEAHGDTVSAVTPCTAPPAIKGKSPQRFESKTLMIVANELESQGEANFHVRYSKPAAECLVESFSVGDVKVQARYSKWEKAASTLLYRFVVERPKGSGSEVLVLYNGSASFASGGGFVFHVSEERDGVISWYAMFKEEPTYAAARALVEQIIAGSAKPLLAVRWPKGAKEGEILAFDDKRLK
jgi:hypothetical protein